MRTTLVSLCLLAICSLPVTAAHPSPLPGAQQQRAELQGPQPTASVTSVDSSDEAIAPEAPTDSLEASDGESQRAASEQAAQDGIDDVQFSGQIFTRYGWNVTSTGATENFNSFALDRWYFTARTPLSETLSFRGTTDILSPAPGTGNGYSIIVKYAYFDWQIQPDLSLRAGVHQTGWENYMNGVWGYRGVTKTMAHYQGHLSTSDLGATLSYSLPSQFGSASVGIHNGQGYKGLEADQFKDVSGQVQLTPFAHTDGPMAPLTISGHAYRGTHADGRPRNRWGGLAAYAGDRYTLGVNYEARTDGAVEGEGVSTFGTVRLGTVPAIGDVSLLGMLNLYDPDATQSDDRMRRGVVGVAVQPTSGLTVTLDYQQRRMETPAFARYDGGQTDTDANLFLHVILNY